jgi:casein kinase II subunit beta
MGPDLQYKSLFGETMIGFWYEALHPCQAKIQASAEYLYGLIHARFVLTNDGLNAVLEKYYKAEYGHCPRTNCMDLPVLPAAVSDNPNEDAVKVR